MVRRERKYDHSAGDNGFAIVLEIVLNCQPENSGN
jgi:hypothetical protein